MHTQSTGRSTIVRKSHARASNAQKNNQVWMLKSSNPGLRSNYHFSAVFLSKFSSVQFSSVAQSSPTLCDPINCSMPGLPVHHQLPEFTQTHVHWVGDAIQPSHPLSFPSPPAPSSPSIRVFSSESTLHMRWPKYWSFSFSISPSKKHPGLISFRMDWLDLLAVQGTLKSLLQHHNSKAPILRRSDFFTVQLSHLYKNYSTFLSLSFPLEKWEN